MTSKSLLRTHGLLLACLASALSACGGGGNELGPADAIQASPASVEVIGSTTSCAVGTGPTVHLYGGAPPYVLRNSVPDGMVLDKTRLEVAGEGFSVTFINGVCLTSMPITVEDTMGRILEVPITNKRLGS
jgi:hypothetical protein